MQNGIIYFCIYLESSLALMVVYITNVAQSRSISWRENVENGKIRINYVLYMPG